MEHAFWIKNWGKPCWLWLMQCCALLPHVTGQQIMLPLLLSALLGPRRIAPSSAENPQSGWQGSKGYGTARNSKNIDWRATSLIRGTLGLWFWEAYSTNFPNQPDVLAFLSDVPWGSTKGFVFSIRETSTVTTQGRFSILTFEDGWYILRPMVSNCRSEERV